MSDQPKFCYLHHWFGEKPQTFFNEFFVLTVHETATCNSHLMSSIVLVRPLLVESLVIIIFYMIFLMCYAVIINYFGKKTFPIKRKQGVNNCFKPLILSVFTTVASRLKSEQKEKEK